MSSIPSSEDEMLLPKAERDNGWSCFQVRNQGFPSTSLQMDILSDFSKQTEGKGYVSLFKMREEGIIPDFIEHENADATGRFCIAAFHQMHCLYLLQSGLWAVLDGTIQAPGSYTLHCLNYLRTSIICAADTTLEPFKSRFNGFPGGNAVDGFGSYHQCRNFDDLYH